MFTRSELNLCLFLAIKIRSEFYLLTVNTYCILVKRKEKRSIYPTLDNVAQKQCSAEPQNIALYLCKLKTDGLPISLGHVCWKLTP